MIGTLRVWLVGLEEGLFLRSPKMGPPWGPIIRVLRFPVALVRDWLGGEINVRAMSLAYTTLLSVVPVIAFSFAVLKLFGASANLDGILLEFLSPLGMDSAEELTTNLMQFVGNMRGDLLGTIGLASLAYTVFATIRKVEASFQFIWRVEQQRSLWRRCTEYVLAMIAGPILVAAGVAIVTSARNNPFERWADGILPLDRMLSVLHHLLPYAIVTLAFTAMYLLVPNTHVRLRAAITGGLGAGIAWALAGKLFTGVILFSSHLLTVYTGFAVVLTSLIWIYISWLILLLGAQLAFYVQHPQYLRHGQSSVELSSAAREQAALSVMVLVGRDAPTGKSAWNAERLALELDIPCGVLLPVIACLQQSALLAAVGADCYSLVRSPEQTSLISILEAVRGSQPTGRPIAVQAVAASMVLMGELETAVRQRLGSRTLQDLIAPPPSLAGDGHLVK
jgi:membrane protein